MNQMVNIIFDSKVSILSKSFLQRQISTVLKNENIPGYNLNVIFVDSKYIQQLNKTYLNKNWETDVIAFALGEADSNILEGEIYICTEVAKQQAREYRVSYKKELLRLAIHGTLHLVGYDDNESEARLKMQKVEDEFLYKAREAATE